MICENCDYDKPDNSIACPNCHAQYKPVPTPCPECGGERILAEPVAGVGYLSLKQWGKAFSKTTEVLAYVCTACGHTSFYARNPMDVVVKRPDKPKK